MKKTLSIILAAAMVLSVLAVFPVTVSAGDDKIPEGLTAIKTEAEFLAMDPAGNYYLAADIAITKTYGGEDGKAFTGTLDGNGKTVTVSAPMFYHVSGTIKNFKVVGEVTTGFAIAKADGFAYDDAASAAVAAFASGATFEGITSDATVNVPKVGETDAAAGAIYGVGWGGVTVTGCTNNGEITGMDQVGGLVGWADRTTDSTFTITDSVNNGTVNMAGNYGGGLVGRGSEGATVIENCVNNGAMNCFKSQFGGMVGYLNHALDVTIVGCVNNGIPADYNTTDTTYPNFGGIVGISYATADCNVTIKECLNTASFDLGAKKEIFGGGIAARLRGNDKKVNFLVDKCVNTGKIGNTQTGAGIIAQIQGTRTGSKDAYVYNLVNATVSNCVNFGEVYVASTATSGTIRGSGIVAHTEYTQFDISNCVNNGALSGDKDASVAIRIGGIVGYQGGDTAANDKSVSSITGCANFGFIKVESKSGDVGGIAANLYQITSITNCFVNAEVIGPEAGGVVGYWYGSDNKGCYPVIKNCVVLGGVISCVKDKAVAAVVAYYNASKAEIQNNYIDVYVEAVEGSSKPAAVLCWNNKSVNSAELVFNNYVPALCGTAVGLINNAEGGDATQVPISLADAITAGFITYKTSAEAVEAINTAIGTDMFLDMRVTVAPICNHNFLNEVTEVGVAPTCTVPGKADKAICVVCGLECGGEEIPATGHTLVEIEPAVEPTCNADGKTAKSQCSVCNEIVGGEVVPSLGGAHTAVDVPAVPATCTEPGKTAGTKCSVCETILSGCEDVPATGHNVVDGKCTQCDYVEMPASGPIKTEAEFLAMQPGGDYYLDADITLTQTYTQTFTGKFDGKGKTVTITAGAMFQTVENATISNFTVNGTITTDAKGFTVGSEDFAAAVAIVANGTTSFKDITSNVNFTTTSSNTRYGAIAATSAEGYDLSIENCVNNGNITVVKYAGGVYGWSAKVGKGYFKNCINNGTIVAEGYAGGIVNRLANSGGTEITLTIENCINNGAITGSYGGGMVAYSNTFVQITGCVNYADITAVSGGSTGGIAGNLDKVGAEGMHIVKNNINFGNVTNTAEKNTGGIIGYVYGSSNYGAIVENNINFGTVSSAKYCSQILGYTNSNTTVIKNNVGAGKLVGGNDNTAVFVGLSSADITQYTILGNYYIENDGTKTYSYADSDDNAHNRVALDARPDGSVIFVTAEKLNGEVAALLNAAIGANTFEIREGKIALICSHDYAKNADGKCMVCNDVAGTIPEISGGDTTTGPIDGETTTGPIDGETTTDPIGGDATTAPNPGTDAPASDDCASCSGLSALAALIAIVCGAAVVIIKKKA